MRIGVTGSRHGLTLAQMTVVTRELQLLSWMSVTDLHHGDCTGVDVQVAAIAAGLGYRTIAHPPTNETHRGCHPSDEVRSAFDYLTRDRHIVDETELLIGCPDGPERPKSGTWYTIGYARKIGRRTLVVDPAGDVVDSGLKVGS